MSSRELNQVWQKLLAQLHQELPNRRIASALAHSTAIASSGDLLTVSLPDQQSLDWVTDRLQTLLERSLRGIVNNSAARLKFILSEQKSEVASNSQELDTVYQISPEYASFHDAIIHPERITAIPGYFLRWLPFMDPASAKLRHARGWLLVALYQAFYVSNHSSLQDKNSHLTLTASGNDLARNSGMTRQSIQNHLRRMRENPADPLRWFIEPLDPPSVPGAPNPANQYRFHLAMPLTPGDADFLQAWLTDHGIVIDPLACLEQALETDRRELLPFPAPPPTAAHFARSPHPQSVQQVVFDMAQISPEDDRYPRLVQLADKLAQRIIPPGDKILITHYFLQNWLPRLGHGPAWLVTALRDRGYINKETGEIRDTIHYRNGYAQLTSLLGLSESDTIGRWLSPSARRRLEPETHAEPAEPGGRHEDVRRLTDLFLRKTLLNIDHHPAGTGGTEIAFKVKLDEVLIPEHQEFYEKFARLMHLAARLRQPDLILQALNPGGEVAAPILHGSPRQFDNLSDGERANLTGIGAISAREVDMSDPAHRASLTEVAALVLQLKALIKHLTPQALKDIQHLVSTQSAEMPQTGLSPVAGEWQVAKILETCGIKTEAIQNIAQKIGTSVENRVRFVAWLLFAYANSENGIHNPGAFAISRWQHQPDPLFETLAQLSPAELYRQLTNQHGQYAHPLQGDALAALERTGFAQLLFQVNSAAGKSPKPAAGDESRSKPGAPFYKPAARSVSAVIAV
jgi:hypothetical protein